MSNIVVVHGPQGCGKTRNAQVLAAHFGCCRAEEDWNGADPLPAGTLALTSARRITPPRRALVISFDAAMVEAGLVSQAL